ncbi:Eco57I restriction-modification methylase domain-containing protein [Hamadaea sp. NPDC050747]|uniref:Eco57I restriction-modification methylase domain-containing protein n=1 Tax=Hamadaea sp. NPDC050747 TaxID=3155789 RepID=UPI0033D04331
MSSVAIPDSSVPNFGEVFTRRWVVDVLLDLSRYTPERDLGSLTLVEPSAGSGAFLLPAIDRLLVSAGNFGRPLPDLASSIKAWELQPEHVYSLRQAVSTKLRDRGASGPTAEKLAHTWVQQGDFLLPEQVWPESESADVVIGNPPYIRLEDLPQEVTAQYRGRWTTMNGRADIYVGFIERALGMLNPEGTLAFICADRWMRNQYGDGLRRLVATEYAVDHVWVMHDVDAFESQVSAYPAITVLRRGSQGPAVAADTVASFNEVAARRLAAWSTGEQQQFVDTGVTAHRLPHWFPGDESWPTGTPARLRLIEDLRDRFGTLQDPATGTKVSIGVATGADGIFVTTNAAIVEHDRLLPLSMVRDLKTGDFKWSGHYLVSPWTSDGKLVALDDYPMLRQYLTGAETTLKSRHIAKNAKERWYRTIDPVHYELTDRPKLLLQDMRTTIHPVLEPGGHYPHHNLYYIVSDKWDMEVLGGLLLSRIAQAFVEAYSVRMRGGTLRFQAQYLKRIRVPDPRAISDATAEALRAAFRSRDAVAATEAAAAAFNIDPRNYDLV